jgi:hypothetical protein
MTTTRRQLFGVLTSAAGAAIAATGARTFAAGQVKNIVKNGRLRRSVSRWPYNKIPGRRELDATQEMNWPAVCRAIVDTGFKGYLAHEFVPTRDPLTSLREAVMLYDV